MNDIVDKIYVICRTEVIIRTLDSSGSSEYVDQRHSLREEVECPQYMKESILKVQTCIKIKDIVNKMSAKLRKVSSNL